LSMLGKTKGTEEINKSKNYGLELINYHDMEMGIQLAGLQYECGYESVLNDYNTLLNYIQKPEIYEKQWYHWKYQP